MQREEGAERVGECCFFKREAERECVREREKGRDLFALQKPGRELSWSAAAWLAHTGFKLHNSERERRGLSQPTTSFTTAIAGERKAPCHPPAVCPGPVDHSGAGQRRRAERETTREGGGQKGEQGGGVGQRGEVGRTNSLWSGFPFFFLIIIIIFLNPFKVLPLCCYVPLGYLEINFIGCIQGINFSGRWKHLEEEEEEEECRMGGSHEQGTKNNSFRQGVSSCHNFFSQFDRNVPLWCAACAGSTVVGSVIEERVIIQVRSFKCH